MSVDFDLLLIGPVVAAFGDPVVYTPQVGIGQTITGVFDSQYVDVNAIGSSMIEQMGSPGNITTSRPVLGVQLSQFNSPPLQGDGLTITTTGASYVVMEVRADGHGWAKLLLNEAP